MRVEDFRVRVTVWVFRKDREVGEENCFGGDVMRIIGQWGGGTVGDSFRKVSVVIRVEESCVSGWE